MSGAMRLRNTKRKRKCNCSLAIRILGDGCSVCNPELSLELITERMEEAEAKLDKIQSWIDAYPLEVFPEPDFKKVARVLKDNGIISENNMRHVLNGISDIINDTIGNG